MSMALLHPRVVWRYACAPGAISSPGISCRSSSMRQRPWDHIHAGFATEQSSDGYKVPLVNWYPGHMAKALRLVRERLKGTHLVLQVRDARIPIASRHDEIETAVKNANKQSVLVLNKADLISHRDKQLCREHFLREDPDRPVIFCSAVNRRTVKPVLKTIREVASKGKRFKTLPTVVMIAGIPNVGKSTIINTLKQLGSVKGKGAKVGAIPGVTQHVSGFSVSTNPPIWVVDSPGIMFPTFKDTPHESALSWGLKIAVTGGVKDSVAGEQTTAEFLFNTLNSLQSPHYVKHFRLPHRIEDWDVMLFVVGCKLDGTAAMATIKEAQEYDEEVATIFADGSGGNLVEMSPQQRHAVARQLSAAPHTVSPLLAPYMPDELRLRSSQYLLKQYRNGKLGLHMLDEAYMQQQTQLDDNADNADMGDTLAQ